MNVIIFGGFLGSGKTTALIGVASRLVQDSATVIILENEISSAGVDNQLLKKKNFTVENIFSGCICCSSTQPLKESVQKIKEEFDPDYLLIEATGMAYPDSIRETLQDTCGIPAGILALADASRWKKVKRAMPDFVSSQLTDAEVIFLTKIDLASPEDRNTAIQEIREINSSALLYPINATEPLDENLITTSLQRLCKTEGGAES